LLDERLHALTSGWSGTELLNADHAWLELAAPRAGDPPIKRLPDVLQRDAAAGGHWCILRN